MIDIELKPLLAKLNKYCNVALEASAGFCVSRGNYEITIEHLLYKLLENPSADIQILLRHYEINAEQLQKQILHVIEDVETGNNRRPVFSSLLIEWLQEAWLISSIELRQAQIRSSVLFAVMLSNSRRYGSEDYFDLLQSIPAESLRNELMDIVSDSIEETTELSQATVAAGAGSRELDPDSALSQFSIHFTEQARRGEIDPVFCRDDEIRQIIDIVSRRRKNNPILVGEPGVGKTAVVEGLALKIVQGDVPDVLAGTEIYALDMGLLQAGASVKGEFEKRLKAVINEVKSSVTPLILFIDEAHTLIGAGGEAGGSDAANLLKPALARGEMKTLAATTWSEYKKYFEKDPALARRFQLVKIGEPSTDEAVVIMRGLRGLYEDSHRVYIRDDAVVASAILSDRYISGRQLPDKSVDLLDTACARVKINQSARPTEITTLEEDIRILQREYKALERDVDTGVSEDKTRLDEITASLLDLEKQKTELNKQWKAELEIVKQLLDLRKALIEEPIADTTVDDKDTEAKDENAGATSVAQDSVAQETDLPEDEPATGIPDTPEAIREKLKLLEKELNDIQGDTPLIIHEVSAEAVSSVVADWTGIPVGSMVRDEANTILKFGENLGQRIKGQDHAIAAVDRKIRASKAGIGNPDSPMAVMLFVGPSGVGKTETALGIADLLFGGERFTITINMSEFQEKHSVSRLIGSPPGYVGYGEGGLLTEAVRQRPYSVVLLDECEKADPEVLNLFYQVFDKGTLSDGEGREVNFRNTIIIMTSNLATNTITQVATTADQKPGLDQLVDLIRPELSAHFKPALLARMDIVPYYPLDQDSLKLIVKLKLDRLTKRLMESQKIRLEYEAGVIDAIAEKCTEVETGARNIDYIINKNLLPNISTEILGMMAEETMPELLKVAIDENGQFVYAFI